MMSTNKLILIIINVLQINALEIFLKAKAVRNKIIFLLFILLHKQPRVFKLFYPLCRVLSMKSFSRYISE